MISSTVYSSDSTEVWLHPKSIAMDISGNVYVAAAFSPEGLDGPALLVKYSPDLELLKDITIQPSIGEEYSNPVIAMGQNGGVFIGSSLAAGNSVVREYNADLVFISSTLVHGAAITDMVVSAELLYLTGNVEGEGVYFAKFITDSGAPPLDVTPPAAVADLGLGEVYSSFLTVFWTAPSDPDDSLIAYDIRYASSVINAVNFDSASTVASPPAPLVPGATQTADIEIPADWTSFFVALKSMDSAGNVSDLSNVAGLSRSTVAVNGLAELEFSAEKPVFAALASTTSQEYLVALASVAEQGLVLITNIYELGPEGTIFDPPAVLTMRWLDSNNNGIVDATELANPINEADLKLKRYNGTEWADVADQTADYNGNFITGRLSSLSLYGLFAKRAEPSVTVSVNLEPKMLNDKGNGRYVLARFRVSGWKTASDIDPASLRIVKVDGRQLTMPIPAIINPHREEGSCDGDDDKDEARGQGKGKDLKKEEKCKKRKTLTLEFDRKALERELTAGKWSQVTFQGTFYGGLPFSAADSVMLLKQGKWW